METEAVSGQAGATIPSLSNPSNPKKLASPVKNGTPCVKGITFVSLVSSFCRRNSTDVTGPPGLKG